MPGRGFGRARWRQGGQTRHRWEPASWPHSLAALWREGLAMGGRGGVFSRYLGLSGRWEGPERTGREHRPLPVGGPAGWPWRGQHRYLPPEPSASLTSRSACMPTLGSGRLAGPSGSARVGPQPSGPCAECPPPPPPPGFLPGRCLCRCPNPWMPGLCRTEDPVPRAAVGIRL